MGRVYQVNEVFHSLQGEGARSGRAAVFCRFAGCNLWSGLEQDRASAVCNFCDTDFRGTNGRGGGRFTSADALAEHILQQWLGQTQLEPETRSGSTFAAEFGAMPSDSGEVSRGFADQPADTERAQQRSRGQRYVVCTGGEPLLQLDLALIAALHARGFEVAVETNGTQPAPAGIDWLCVSPKAGAPLRLRSGDELKLVFPQSGALPEQFADLDFDHFYLQPMDGPQRDANTQRALAYCKGHPQWRLSLQLHKLLGIP
ncbi:radical SAM family protein [Halochromatium sp.]